MHEASKGFADQGDQQSPDRALSVLWPAADPGKIGTSLVQKSAGAQYYTDQSQIIHQQRAQCANILGSLSCIAFSQHSALLRCPLKCLYLHIAHFISRRELRLSYSRNRCKDSHSRTNRCGCYSLMNPVPSAGKLFFNNHEFSDYDFQFTGKKALW